MLHVITFIILKTMNDKLKLLGDMEEKYTENKKELEDLLAVYLLEIKDENDRLVSSLRHNKPLTNSQSEKVETEASTKSERSTIPIAYNNKSVQPSAENSTTYTPPLSNQEQDTLEQSISAKVYALYDQGETIESIARKLDCGKTEVELMLKFNRKNS
ncbi:hypothetical protein JOC48_002553 [Aquibacillus albus]|uniref:Helix-turn-helix domain-containing protein n=2 Tax=Aquibacillus albus TaxID=1168171 RepID=A0ABS2N1P9_9BACI|nr:hypothetical protein [Aquibacillus albus]